jgi:hypothetical protein
MELGIPPLFLLDLVTAASFSTAVSVSDPTTVSPGVWQLASSFFWLQEAVKQISLT